MANGLAVLASCRQETSSAVGGRRRISGTWETFGLAAIVSLTDAGLTLTAGVADLKVSAASRYVTKRTRSTVRLTSASLSGPFGGPTASRLSAGTSIGRLSMPTGITQKSFASTLSAGPLGTSGAASSAAACPAFRLAASSAASPATLTATLSFISDGRGLCSLVP